MKKTTLYLTEEQDARTKELARVQGRSQAEVIRAAIDAFALRKPPRPRSIGMGRGPGGGSIADNKREWLKGMGEWRR
jgi:FAD/FMN-containing dehydrogenase